MSWEKEIKDAIREMAYQELPYAMPCTVSNVSEAEMTCDCTPIDGTADFLGVRIMADVQNGWALIPKDGSIVMVCPINESGAAYVCQVSTIDKIIGYIDSGNSFEFSSSGFIFNGGTLDGMVKINDLVTKLNNLENAFNTHITAYNLHTHAGVTVGGGATAVPIVPDAQTLTPTVKANLENTKIKQ